MHPSLQFTATGRGGVFTPDDARAAGYTTRQIRDELDAGRWVAIRRGIYASRELRDATRADPLLTHRLETAAALTAMGRQAAASHVSAAVVLGLELADPPGSDIHVTTVTGTTHRGPRLVVHCADLDESETEVRHELRVTRAGRTVYDVARSLPFSEAVATADFALHAGLTTPEELRTILHAHETWPGRGRASRVIRFADGRSDSVGESLGRVGLAVAGVPTPVLQWEMRDDDGLIGFADYAWPGDGVVGEFDGRQKYQSPGDLYREKRREDRIRRLGLGVLRFGYQEARYRPQGLLLRWEQARQSAGPPWRAAV